MRTTTLAQSNNVNIGWILLSHPKYGSQEMAKDDLQRRMERESADFELIPHTTSHVTGEGKKSVQIPEDSGKLRRLKGKFSKFPAVFQEREGQWSSDGNVQYSRMETDPFQTHS